MDNNGADQTVQIRSLVCTGLVCAFDMCMQHFGNPLPHRDAFNTFANRGSSDQVLLCLLMEYDKI